MNPQTTEPSSIQNRTPSAQRKASASHGETPGIGDAFFSSSNINTIPAHSLTGVLSSCREVSADSHQSFYSPLDERRMFFSNDFMLSKGIKITHTDIRKILSDYMDIYAVISDDYAANSCCGACNIIVLGKPKFNVQCIDEVFLTGFVLSTMLTMDTTPFSQDLVEMRLGFSNDRIKEFYRDDFYNNRENMSKDEYEMVAKLMGERDSDRVKLNFSKDDALKVFKKLLKRDIEDMGNVKSYSSINKSFWRNKKIDNFAEVGNISRIINCYQLQGGWYANYLKPEFVVDRFDPDGMVLAAC